MRLSEHSVSQPASVGREERTVQSAASVFSVRSEVWVVPIQRHLVKAAVGVVGSILRAFEIVLMTVLVGSYLVIGLIGVYVILDTVL